MEEQALRHRCLVLDHDDTAVMSTPLGRKIGEGCFDVQTARVIARRLLYDNPIEIFRLREKGISVDAEK
jgi:hypothetical protein